MWRIRKWIQTTAVSRRKRTSIPYPDKNTEIKFGCAAVWTPWQHEQGGKETGEGKHRTYHLKSK